MIDPHPIAQWLISAASREQGLEGFFVELKDRLVGAGIPVWRQRMTVLAMHPEVFGRVVSWTPATGVTLITATQDMFSAPSYRGGPVEAIHLGAEKVRCRLDQGPLRYPQLSEIREAGGTEYVALALEFGKGRRTFISFATIAPSGFTDAQVSVLEALLPAIAIRAELESSRFSTQTLLNVYLGPNAAKRVLAGDFRRGTGEVTHAAIWLCDLRGFTNLTDRLPVSQIVHVLDQYFEAVARPISAEGGEILKFIGDSILAVFPTEGDATSACRRAVASAAASIEAFAKSEPALRHQLRVGVAVNVGEVMYGNIGANDRLDFTVIGTAVNEAARMEALCKALKTPLVFSADVAQHVPGHDVVPLGRHALRGVTGDRSLFTLRPYAPTG